MPTYWLTDLETGDTALVDGGTIEQVLGVELGYVDWCIEQDGKYENGKWKVVADEGQKPV